MIQQQNKLKHITSSRGRRRKLLQGWTRWTSRSCRHCIRRNRRSDSHSPWGKVLVRSCPEWHTFWWLWWCRMPLKSRKVNPGESTGARGWYLSWFGGCTARLWGCRTWWGWHRRLHIRWLQSCRCSSPVGRRPRFGWLPDRLLPKLEPTSFLSCQSSAHQEPSV
jgi:hypothetical protein